ncbi:hypothetical protein GCM10027442_18960 [Emticicia fontis]
MNQNVSAQTPCTAPINYTLVGVDATTATANNAKLRISGALSGDNRIGYSVGNTYTGPNFAAATKYSVYQADSSYISRTLPTPTNTAGTEYTIRVYSEDGSCYTDKTYTLEYVNFNTTPVNPDIEVITGVTGVATNGTVALNGTASVLITVKNNGTGPATGVVYTIGIPAGFTGVTGTTATGTYNGSTTWNIGTLAAGQTVTLTLTGTVATRGVKYITANLSAENEVDIDSSPTTNNAGEDDQASACISTPFDYCSNDEYTITLPSYTGIEWKKNGTTVITEGNAASNGVRLNADKSLTIFSAGEYSYSMTVGPNACPSGGCCPIIIEAGKPPVLVAPTDQSICFNATFTAITAQNTQATSNGTFVYEWYNDNGAANPTSGIIAGQNALTFTALPTAVGVYKYKLKAYEQEHPNCADSVTITLTIRDLPVISIAAVAPVCAEDTISLKTVGTVTGDTYAWTGPASFTSTEANPDRLNAITDFAGTYAVTVTNGAACSASATTSVVVNILPLPPVTQPKVFCAEDAKADLVAEALPGNTLIWYGTNSTGGVATATIEQYNPTTAGITTFYVSQKDANGCESHRSPLEVKVNTKPGVPDAKDVTYCQGVKADSLVAIGASGYNIYWYGQNSTGGTATMVKPVPSTVDVGTFTFYATQKDEATGCESNRDPAVVKVNTTPTAPVISAVTYCEQETATALTANGDTGNTIIWYEGGGTRTTAPTPNTSVAGLTYFYVTQTIPGTGCESGMSAVPVTVNPKPVATVIAVNSLCVGSVSQNNAQLILTRYRNSDEVSYNIGSTYGTPTPSTYATVPSGGIFASNLPNPTAATQDYTVRIKNSFNCTIDRVATLTKTDCACPGGYCEPATVTKKKL